MSYSSNELKKWYKFEGSMSLGLYPSPLVRSLIFDPVYFPCSVGSS